MTKTIKKTLALILSIVMLMSVVPMGYSFAVGATVCGDYEYILSEDKATITKYKGTDTVVEIPGTLDGYPVVALSFEEEVATGHDELMPFKKNYTLKSVAIPDSVEYIGYGAFYQCTSLATVDLGNGVEVIGAGAFRGCKKLTSVVLWSVTTLEARAFKDCTSLNTIVIGEDIESIAADAFAGCTNLKTVNFGGTAEQWAEIVGDTAVFGDNVTINFNYYDCAVLGHKEKEIPAVKATCVENGNTAGMMCDECGEVLVETELIEAPGHRLVKIDAVKETCDRRGNIEHWNCNVCGKNFANENAETELKDVIIPASHNLEKIEAVKPTCFKDGNIEYYACKACSLCFKDEKATAEIKKRDYTIKYLEHKTETVRYQAPTCTEEGCTGYVYCTLCETLFSDASLREVITIEDTVIPENGHSWSRYYKDGKDGKHYLYCTVKECSVLKEDSVQEHIWGEGRITVEPTCTEKGVKYFFCTVINCNARKSEEVPANGHTEVYHEQAATCTKEGKKGEKWCTVCEKFTADAETIPALGHDWIKLEGHVDATCYEDGIDNKICAVCGEEAKGETARLEHEYPEEWYIKTQATCTTDGEQLKLCTICRDLRSLIEEVITAPGHNWEAATCTAAKFCKTCNVTEGEELGHSFTNYVADGNATCLEDGTKTAKCDRCDETDTLDDEESALGHSFTDYVSNEDATCLEDGTKTAECDRCDETNTLDDEESALGHSFTNYVSNEDATCLEDGTKTAKCDRCDETNTLDDEESALGHSFTNYVTDGNATCLEDGTKTAKCDRCNVTNTLDDIDSATGHTIVTIDAVAPTCLKSGYTEGKKCSVCDVVTVAQVVVPANGHNNVTISAQEPTCTEPGWDEFELCLSCGLSNCVEIEATGHTKKRIPGTKATCTEAGLTDLIICEECEEVIEEQETIDALGHDYVIDEEVSKAVTCTEDGIEKADCSRCNATYTREIKAEGHKVTNWVVSEEATCKQEGLLIAKCHKCPTVLREKTPKTAHTDENADNKCDVCDAVINASSNEGTTNPDDSNNDNSGENKVDCTCYCHQSGILRFFFYDIPLIFFKLFGINRECACGALHY